MRPDDPRHGTEAGYMQHYRDSERPCDDCSKAKMLAARRRNKRKTMGHRYQLPAGKAWERLLYWRDGGASLNDIERHAGIEESVAVRITDNGPEQLIYARTFLAIMQAPAKMPLTTIGATRRIRALMWLGYSANVIAEHSGIHHETIADARQPRVFVALRVREAIAETYERLHMRLPSTEERYQKASVSRTRNYARKHGWLPPLAWDDIDDGNEHPEGAPMQTKSELDPIVVERIVSGDYRMPATDAERLEVIRIWQADGIGNNEIVRRTGWNIWRYLRMQREAS